jgi:hypothetical protein
VVSELDRVPDRAGRIAPVGIAELLLALVALTAPPMNMAVVKCRPGVKLLPPRKVAGTFSMTLLSEKGPSQAITIASCLKNAALSESPDAMNMAWLSVSCRRVWNVIARRPRREATA